MLKQLVNRLTVVPLIGVDVGSDTLKAVEVSVGEGRVTLRRQAVRRLEGAEMARALEQLCADLATTTRHVALGLAAPEVVVKPFQFPPMPKKELASAIRLEAEQAILNGHAPSDTALDWHILSSSKELVRGVLAVVPKAILSHRIKAVRASGLQPTVVDVEGLALWNAYWTLVGSEQRPSQTVFLVNIGARSTNLVIARGPDALMLLRDLQLGGQALSGGQGQEWLAEVRDSLGYARSQGGLRALDAVVVTGGGSGPTLIPLLKAAVNAPVTFWNPLSDLARADDCPPIDEAQGPLLAVAIGLALRQPS